MAMAISSEVFPITCLVFVLFITRAVAQQTFVADSCPNDVGNYTAHSTYQANLNQLLSNVLALANHTAEVGRVFYNSSYGNASDEVYAIALCRGDVSLDVCRDCLGEARRRIAEVCPNQKQAAIWYDYCMLRYSNSSISGVMGYNTYPQPPIFVNGQNVSSSSLDAFSRQLWSLLDALRNRAAAGGLLRKFATGNASVTDIDTIYALVQCTPDLSSQDCSNCLDDAFGDFRQCCGTEIGGQVNSVSCNFRYETDLFYNDTADDVPATSSPPLQPPAVSPSPPSSTTTNTTNAQGKEKSNTTRTVIIVVASTTAGFMGLIISVCAYLIITRSAKKKVETQQSYVPVQEIESAESFQYSFETIRVATDNFCEQNKLGQGGFGSVYRGKLLNGQDIAVKRLSSSSGQGNLEFKNEVTLVAKLQHRNLVRLYGFCLEGSERLLVYEFVPNASLDQFIFDPSKRANLDWDRRYKIIGGIARGILYLHEDSRLRIIHRDLKASNILLDEDMHPKIADFGMARLFMVDQTQGNTSRIVGTYGYMAPEYAMHGHFSVKSDVFSFGVLLLEIISGQKNNCFRQGEHVEDLLSYAWRNWCHGTASTVVDPLVRHGSVSEIMRCIHIALLCVQENVARRPTMNTVVLMLNSNSLSLPVPSEPAFFMNSEIGSDMPLAFDSNSRTIESDHSKSQNQASENEASVTDLYPR